MRGKPLNSMSLRRKMALLILAPAIIGYGIWEFSNLSQTDEPAEFGELRSGISELLERVSAPDAYAIFKQQTAALPEEKRHAAAHIFGEALYRKEGVEGVSVCDSSFGFGCYHSFFGIAIAEHGPKIASILDSGCFKAYGVLGTGCPHGIGHGLMWHLGDTELAAALSYCREMRYQGTIGGCSDGVFMEYNEHTMATGGGWVGRRPYEEGRRHEPCTEIEARFREACYYRQSDWWFRSLGGDVKTVGAYCAEAMTLDEQTACYRGLGYTIATEARYVPDVAAASCKLLETTTARNRCLEGAAWALISNPEHASSASLVCSAAGAPTVCMENAVLIR